jgi:putative phosphoribosyl transferase
LVVPSQEAVMVKHQHEWPFRDRYRAGEWLAGHLQQFGGEETVVLGIPRGGVEVAAAVADRLNAALDVIVARKIGAPDQPELAIGAVTANGGLYLDQESIHLLGVSERYLASTVDAERAEAQRREREFRDDRPYPVLENRVVLIVDDGLATGATARAAARAVRQHNPEILVLTAPVGSREAIASLSSEVDQVVCPLAPEFFWAVGGYYVDFHQLQDADVTRLLREYAKHHNHQGETRSMQPRVLGR